MNIHFSLAVIDLFTIGSGIGVFLAIIIVLIALLLLARRHLVTQGDVKILINDNEDNTVISGRGQTLLSSLMDKKIILPSACGGGGTCAMCKCKVLEGGGDVLPTEKTHLSRKEQQEGVRLACQLKVKNDLKIEVEPEILSIKKWECTVRSNHNVATFIKEFIVDLPKGENLDFKAGGYIQIDIPKYKDLGYKGFEVEEEYHEDWNNYKVFDHVAQNNEEIFRAYSMANHPAEGNMVMLNVRIATPPPRMPNVLPGKASSYIFNLKPGDKVTISGPFGEFFMKDTDKEIMFIGGGAGMAPMRSHIFDLFHTRKSNRKTTFWYGARSKREMFYDDEYKAIEKEFPNFKYYVGLSDPLEGDNWEEKYIGFIHDVVYENYLKNHEAPEDIEYYLCGPGLMLEAVTKMLVDLGVDQEMIAFDDFG